MTSIKISDLFLRFFIRRKRRNLFRFLRLAPKEKNVKRFPWPSNRLSRSTSVFFLATHRRALVFVLSAAKGQRSHFFGSYAHFLKQTFSAVCDGLIGWKTGMERETSSAAWRPKTPKNLSCLSSDENLLLHDLFSLQTQQKQISQQ